jgi:hypothetical protein
MSRTETTTLTSQGEDSSDAESEEMMRFGGEDSEGSEMGDESVIGGGLDYAKVAAKKKAADAKKKAIDAKKKKAVVAKKKATVTKATKKKVAKSVATPDDAPVSEIAKKKRRFHPGVVAKRKTKKLQSTPGDNIAPRSPIERMVRDCLAKTYPDRKIKVSGQFVRALHYVFENDMQCIMEAVADLHSYRKPRATIDTEALRFAVRKMNTGIDPVVFDYNCPELNADRVA